MSRRSSRSERRRTSVFYGSSDIQSTRQLRTLVSRDGPCTRIPDILAGVKDASSAGVRLSTSATRDQCTASTSASASGAASRGVPARACRVPNTQPTLFESLLADSIPRISMLDGLGSVRITAPLTFSPDSERRVRLRHLGCAKTATTTVDRKRSDTFCVWCSNGLAPSAARRQTISLTRSTKRHRWGR